MGTAPIELLSPELVLVDPQLAERARRLTDAVDGALELVRPLSDAAPERTSPPRSAGIAAVDGDEEVRQALRRITEIGLESDFVPAGWYVRRAVRVAASATAAIALGATFGLVAAGWTGGVDERAQVARAQERTSVNAPQARDGPAVEPVHVPGMDAPVFAIVDHDQRVPATVGESVEPRRDVSRGTPAQTSQPRAVAWTPVSGAASYHVEIVREGARVFSTYTRIRG